MARIYPKKENSFSSTSSVLQALRSQEIGCPRIAICFGYLFWYNLNHFRDN